MGVTDDSKELTANRSRVKIRPGEYVQYEGKVFKLTSLIDFKKVIALDVVSNKTSILEVNRIVAMDTDSVFNEALVQDGEDISDDFAEVP